MVAGKTIMQTSLNDIWECFASKKKNYSYFDIRNQQLRRHETLLLFLIPWI